MAECLARVDELNDFEKSFIQRVINGTYLSKKQELVIDRTIAKLNGQRWSKHDIKVDFGIFNAEMTEEGYRITVDGVQITESRLVRTEAAIVSEWLAKCAVQLREVLMKLKPEDLKYSEVEQDPEPPREQTTEQHEEPPYDDPPF